MIKYTTKLEDVSVKMLTGGFFVDWPNPPSADTHLKLLQGSYRNVLAIDEERNQVVGFINSTSDGVLSAYIPLLEVLPSYQGQGIGKKLVELLLKELEHLYMVDLLCDENLQSYYSKLGMKKAQGMMIRNYSNQSGSRS